MNDMAYLQQISATNRPTPASGSLAALFHDKMFRLVGILVVVALLILGALAIISASMPQPTTAADELSRIYLRSVTLSETVKSYNSSVKSSELRADGASLSAVLADLSSNSATILSSAYQLETKSLSSPQQDTESLAKTADTLSQAKLNGLLDRYYASELSYQISYLILLEDSALTKTDDTAIRDYLTTSRSSLQTLQASFAKFSEAK